MRLLHLVGCLLAAGLGTQPSAAADKPAAKPSSPAAGGEASASSLAVEVGGGYVSQAGTLPGGPPSSIEHIAFDYKRAGRLGEMDAGLALRGSLDYADAAPSRSEGAGSATFELRRSFDGVETSGTFSYGAVRVFDLREREAKAVERVSVRLSPNWLAFATFQQRHLDYDSFSVKGVFSNENDRDRVIANAEAGLDYSLAAAWTARFSVLGEVGIYAQPFDDFGYRRDYVSATPLVGLVYSGDAVSWAFQAGYMSRAFRDDAFATLTSPVGSTKLTWQASDDLKIVVGAQAAFDDPQFFESRAARSVQASAGIGYRIGSADVVELTGTIRRLDYTDLPRHDTQWLVAGEWTHALAGKWSLVSRVSYGRRELPFFALGYDQTTARISLRYQG